MSENHQAVLKPKTLNLSRMSSYDAIKNLEELFGCYKDCPVDCSNCACGIAIAAIKGIPSNARFADCHIWETGDKLETISDTCEVLIKAADIRELIAQPSSEPQTLEQLMEKALRFNPPMVSPRDLVNRKQ